MPGIKFTSEIREDFPDEWGLPTLDTVMKMEAKRDVVGRMRRLQYRLYRKPMATDLVLWLGWFHCLTTLPWGGRVILRLPVIILGFNLYFMN